MFHCAITILGILVNIGMVRRHNTSVQTQTHITRPDWLRIQPTLHLCHYFLTVGSIPFACKAFSSES